MASGGWCCLAAAKGAYQNTTSLGSSFGVGCFTAAKLAKMDTVAEADLVRTASCTPSATSSSTSTPTTEPTGGPTSDTSGGGGSGATSVSAGGIAGIAVGAVAAVVLFSALGFILLRRSRKKKSSGGQVMPVHEAYGKEVKTPPQPHSVHEMPTERQPHYELPAN